MSRMRGLLVSVVVLCLWPLAPLPADPVDRLFIRPWIELEPLVRIGDGPYPIPVTDAEKSLLGDARMLFSGMVYGWSFLYIPSDKARHVEETFELTPFALIAAGTPRMRVVETEVSDKKLWARVAYAMDDEEVSRRAAWDSNIADMSTGTGTAEVIGGPQARADSLKNAIRDAIRLALDTRYLNKPRQITGDVVLWEDPTVLVRAGTYTTSAKVKLVVRELVPYRIY
jgi:hypothetical protein